MTIKAPKMHPIELYFTIVTNLDFGSVLLFLRTYNDIKSINTIIAMTTMLAMRDTSIHI